MKKQLLTWCLMVMAICNAQAQEILETDIARHNFFYAGQSKQRRMFIVKDGQIIWSYQDQLGRGEIYYPAHRTDRCGIRTKRQASQMCGDGNTLFSHSSRIRTANIRERTCL